MLSGRGLCDELITCLLLVLCVVRYRSMRRADILSVVSVVCCQVEVSVTHRSRVQRSHTDCGASFCVIQKPRE